MTRKDGSVLLRLWRVLFILLLLGVSAAQATPLCSAQEFLTKVDSDYDAGDLGYSEALLYKFHYIFDQTQLPASYRVQRFSPLRCATAIIAQYHQNSQVLSAEARGKIEQYLTQSLYRQSYLSSAGHFNLSYDTGGPHAVSTTDVDPANGVPDFVEKVAGYLEQSWTREIDELGFLPPPIGGDALDVSFANLATYGYTTDVNATLGLSRIVLHSSFAGFPPNADPDGDALGAAKVTAAHEFKHTSQYAGSRWSEGDWIELDAVWVEDLVFDATNDYYNYLLGESPIRHPEIPLDGEDGSGGSYEDCVFQHWLSQSLGSQIVVDFWSRRTSHQSEPVLTSWQSILAQYDKSFAEGWPVFTAWNYGTGLRSVTGLGYSEAAAYPYGGSVAMADSYPFAHSGIVAHLAAEFIHLVSLNDDPGTVDITFIGDADASLTLSAFIIRNNGTGIIQVVDLDEDGTTEFSLGVPMDQINKAGLIVGNAALSGPGSGYSLTVARAIDLPDPELTLGADELVFSLRQGQTTSRILELSNTGEAGSVLDYTVQPWVHGPLGDVDRSVAGSSLTCSEVDYLPGSTIALQLSAYNGSLDDEWLTDVFVDFPDGVSVISYTDLVGGSLGPMTSTSPTGAGANLAWHGTYGSQNYGVIRDGETATATVLVLFDPAVSGDLEFNWTISGDAFGGAPHSLSGTFSLAEASPLITLLQPNGGGYLAAGQSAEVTWNTSGVVEYVDVELSRDEGDTWESLAQNLANTGSYTFEVQPPASGRCLFKVVAVGLGQADVSDAPTTIYEPLTWLSVTPASGQLTQGQAQNLDLYVDTSGLALGAHTGFLIFTHGPALIQTALPVHLTVADPIAVGPIPQPSGLHGNYPNPFNPHTAISFSLSQASYVTLEILDLRGQLVRVLGHKTLASGYHQIVWDGTDSQGRSAATGAYLVRLKTKDYQGVSKMTLVR